MFTPPPGPRGDAVPSGVWAWLSPGAAGSSPARQWTTLGAAVVCAWPARARSAGKPSGPGVAARCWSPGSTPGALSGREACPGAGSRGRFGCKEVDEDGGPVRDL